MGARKRKWGPGAGSGVHSAPPVSRAAHAAGPFSVLCATQLLLVVWRHGRRGLRCRAEQVWGLQSLALCGRSEVVSPSPTWLGLL